MSIPLLLIGAAVLLLAFTAMLDEDEEHRDARRRNRR